MRVVIIGAGVVGLASAWELAQRGHEVSVLERDVPGSGATGAAAGMLAPVAEARYGERDLVRTCLRSREMWPEFAARLEEASGGSVDYRTDGTLVVAVDRDDLEKLTHTHALHVELGLHARMLDGDEARELEPMLAPGVPGAVHCADDHQVDARRVVAALSAAAQAAGVVLHTGIDVRDFRVEHGRVVGLDCEDFESPSDATYVLAAGAWSRRMPSLGGGRPQVRPVRGQMLSVELGDPALCRHVIRAPDAYLAPKSDGRLLIGATMEEVGFDARLTAGGVMDLLVGAWEAMPAIYDQPIVETWTGFRPLSIDGEPIMRRSEQFTNLVLATGHGRNGILLAPLTGQRVADIVSK